MHCGIIAGPLFLFIVLIQDYTRPHYDPRLELISLLSLGDLGWVQIANFALCGMLDICYAAGLRRVLRNRAGGTWAPILIGAYGAGLIVVAACTTDPSMGFPPGAATPNSPTWHGAIHALGGLFIFIALTASVAVFARVFAARKERGWAIYCGGIALVLPALFLSSFSSAALTARFLRLATLLGWLTVSIVALKLSTLGPGSPDRPPGEPRV